MKNKKLTLLGVTMCSVLLLTTGCGEVAKLKDGKEVVGKLKDIQLLRKIYMQN